MSVHIFNIHDKVNDLVGAVIYWPKIPDISESCSVNIFVFFSLAYNLQQCIRLESANYFHIWPRRLDELPRGAASTQGHESSLRNHQSPTGQFSFLAVCVQPGKRLVLTTYTLMAVQGGHFVFIDNPEGFHSAIFYACRKFLSGEAEEGLSLPDGLISAWGVILCDLIPNSGMISYRIAVWA